MERTRALRDRRRRRGEDGKQERRASLGPWVQVRLRYLMAGETIDGVSDNEKRYEPEPEPEPHPHPHPHHMHWSSLKDGAGVEVPCFLGR